MPQVKKTVTILISIVISILTFTSVSAFTDLNSSQYPNAINDLKQRNIVQGYEDGSFQPKRELARAELTKIILESLNISLQEPSQCFPDVDITQWYATYICTAKTLGWLEGYPDGTVQPAALVARSEALKIIAEAEKWQLSNTTSLFSDTPAGEWFTAYANTAKAKNVTPYGNQLNPLTTVTREEFAEIYHRILVTKENNSTVYKTEFSSETNNEPINEPINNQELDENITTTETTQTSGNYEPTIFNHVVLTETLPSTFYKNEVYILEGELVNNNFDSLFAFIYPKGDKSSKTLFKANAINGNFEIPLHLKDTGTYLLGIIPGESGSSLVAEISVVNSVPSATKTTETEAIGNFKTPTFDTRNTYINFSSNTELQKIDLTQNNETVTYYNRQGSQKIPVYYSDFQNFNRGNVSVTISGAVADNYKPITERTPWQTFATGNFYATNHYFSEIDKRIELDNTPLDFNNGETVTFSGITNLEITPRMSVITPDGFVEDISVASNNYNPGDRFSYSYTPTENKIYIIEINKPAGDSAINHPIYPLNQYPLLPDPLDLNPLTLNPDSNFSEAEAITKMLSLINEARINHGLDPVELNSELTIIAKTHNQDMVANEYLDHINLEGQSPDDRRIAAGYPNIVGENIALTTSVEHGHNGFMRSAIHRRNILTPEWTQVGLSLLKNNDGYIYIAQEFSFTNSDFTNEVADTLNDYNLRGNNELQTVALAWSQKMDTENFYGTSNNGDVITTEIGEVEGISQARVYVLRGNTLDAIQSNIETIPELDDSSWNERGNGFVIDEDGYALITILFGK